MNMDTSKMIFVFGSNLAGIHGAGAARHAHDHRGAAWGVGEGITGNCYAIPTKHANVRRTLPLETIRMFVDRFIDYAFMHQDKQFQVTCIGCGLAGLKHKDIAPMFKDAPVNCFFDELWRYHMRDLPKERFWGSF